MKEKRMVKIYRAGDIAPQLNEAQPLFAIGSQSIYALRERDGKPTGEFIRVNKNRKLKGKKRKEARQLARILNQEIKNV